MLNQPHIETHGARSGKCSDTRPPDPHPRLFFEQLAYLSAFSFTIQPSVKHFEEFLWVSFKFLAIGIPECLFVHPTAISQALRGIFVGVL